MSIVRTYDVFCDGISPSGHHCSNWAHDQGSSENGAVARANAKAVGWKRRGSVDLCPRCAELGNWPEVRP